MTKHANRIEVIVRGVCVLDGCLLYCRSKGDANTYLPGGHVDFEESAPEALCREIEEEMGKTAEVGRFLGAVEHTFMQKGRCHCEVNLVFELSIGGLTSARDPKSCEKKISFGWVPLAGLAASPLEPAPLRDVIPRWLTAGPGLSPWASTF